VSLTLVSLTLTFLTLALRARLAALWTPPGRWQDLSAKKQVLSRQLLLPKTIRRKPLQVTIFYFP
jgi:hypothetical protein